MIWRNKKIRYGLLAFIVCSCLLAGLDTADLKSVWKSMSSFLSTNSTLPVATATIDPDHTTPNFDAKYAGMYTQGTENTAEVYKAYEKACETEKSTFNIAKEAEGKKDTALAELNKIGEERDNVEMERREIFDNFEKDMQTNITDEKAEEYKAQIVALSEKINNLKKKYDEKKEEYDKIESDYTTKQQKYNEAKKERESAEQKYESDLENKGIFLISKPGTTTTTKEYLTAVHELFHAHMNQIYPSTARDTATYCSFDENEHEGFATLMTYLFYKAQDGITADNAYKTYTSEILPSEYEGYFNDFVDKVYKSQVKNGLETDKAKQANELTAENVYDYLKELASTRTGACKTSQKTGDLTPSFGDDEEDETSDGGSAPDAGSSSSDGGDSTRQGSDGENVDGDKVCYPEDGSGSSSGSSSGNAEGDEVCYPGDDEGNDSGKDRGNDSEDGADDDSYTVGDVIDTIAEQFAIVGPNIPHYRLLWVFSGESLTTIGGDLWDAAAGVFSDSSGRLDKVKDSFEKAKSREWELK